MRATLLRQAAWAAAVLVVASCSNPNAGSDLPGGAGASSDGAASALPPPVNVTQRSLPSASPSYPTGHPSLQPSTANSKQTSTSRSSANGKLEAVDSTLPVTDAIDSAGAHSNDDSNFDGLEIVDASLKGKLTVLRVGSEPTVNNLLSVFAGLKNKTARPLPLEVQTIYKDRTGDPLNAGSWIPMTLKPHEETEYRSASISPDATDFVVRIRRASESK